MTETEKLINKILDEKGPMVATEHSAQSCLVSLLLSDKELYEKCLDTPDFAFWFSQLVNRAVRYDTAPKLARMLQKAIEQRDKWIRRDSPCLLNDLEDANAELDAIARGEG